MKYSIKKVIPALFCFVLVSFFSFTAPPLKNMGRLSFSFDKSKNLPWLDPPYVSGVINDITDPASTKGIFVSVLNNQTLVDTNEYTVSAISSNTNVVNETGIKIDKCAGGANICIHPTGVGFSDITVNLKTGSSTKSLIINYGASAAGGQNVSSLWHTGTSDASAVLVQNNKYMIVGDDELNCIKVYDRTHSGLAVASYWYGDKLDLSEGESPNYKEVDVEACIASPTNPARTYWLGSMTNGSNYQMRPNRNRIFAVDITDTGAATKFSFAGYYDNLRTELAKWGDNSDLRLGKSAAEGKNAKAIDGFNAEGLAFAPDNTTLWIGFRAPLEPVTDRTEALIAPLLNFETWFNSGKPKQRPVFGAPIKLDLGGRGIRDMIRLSNGIYIIVAGSFDETHNGAIYKWSGNITDSAVFLDGFNIKNYNGEAVAEVDDDNGKLDPYKLQLVSDEGNVVFYGDGIPAKLIEATNFRKFNSDIISADKPALEK